MSWTTGSKIIYTLFLKTHCKFFFSQFAYHEASYFLIRLLQEFTGFTLDKSNNIQPPAEWATCEGLKGTEKIQPGSHLTMFVRVSVFFFRKYEILRSVLLFP